jgi:hypothetical protein
VSKRSRGDGDLLARALAELATYAEGVHQLEPGGHLALADLPAALRTFYRHADGAELFHGAIVLAPAAGVRIADGRARIGELEGDDLLIDVATGAIWRAEDETGELLEEATSFDRFLLGAIEAEGVLYDREGEFVGGIDEDGELEDEAAIARERKRVRRDPDAPAPRWRLARALARGGKLEAARDELEAVVAARPAFGWAWYDLARLAERLGDPAAARDDAIAAAEAEAGYEHNGFFWAHAARLAAAAGDAAGAARCAAEASKADPGLARTQREGAEAQLAAGELDAAAELAELAAIVAPKDLAVADLRKRIAAARAKG